MANTPLNHTASAANRFLGKLFFRALGTLCLVAAFGAAWVGWQAWNDWNPEASPVGLALAGVFILGMIWAVRFCFSPKRTMIEALDAMEGTAGDLPRRRNGDN